MTVTCSREPWYALKGPPEAVKIIFAISVLLRPEKRFHKALCSESMGIICSRYFMTKWPPATSVSLLAKATRLPASKARKVGLSPTAPTRDTTTRSHPGSVAMASRLSVSLKTGIENSSLRALACWESAILANLGLNSAICLRSNA